MPYDDPVLALYDRLEGINDQVMAALEADLPGRELMNLLEEHRTAMADLARTEAGHGPDAKTVPARLAGAKRLKAHVEAVQKKLKQKSRGLVEQREKSHRTSRALDAYRSKK